jgi:hypothetical protein
MDKKGDKMVIKLVEDKDIWDRFVDNSKDGLLFHKWDFLKIMEKHTNCELLSYGIYDKSNTLICIFPLFFNSSKGLKMVFSPPPRTGVTRLGFVMNQEFDSLKQNKKEVALRTVAEDFNEEIKKISPNYISVSLVQNFLDVREFKWKNYDIDVGFTYMFDLDQSLDEIWGNIRNNLKNKITQICGLDLRLLSDNNISRFYESEKKRYEKKGLNFEIISKDYLEDLFKTYPENLKLKNLYDNNDNIVSTQLDCEYKDRFTLWLGGAKPQGNAHYNEYRIWNCIKAAKDAGYKRLDWGGGPQSIFQFKSKFNPTLNLYFTIYKKDIIGKSVEWVYLNIMKNMCNINYA